MKAMEQEIVEEGHRMEKYTYYNRNSGMGEEGKLRTAEQSNSISNIVSTD